MSECVDKRKHLTTIEFRRLSTPRHFQEVTPLKALLKIAADLF